VHRKKTFIIKTTDAQISQIYFVKKIYMFRAVPLPIIGSFPLYIRHRYMSSNLHDIYTSAECTVGNSWWWAERLPETCRVSGQNKFWKLMRLVGFIIKEWDYQLRTDSLTEDLVRTEHDF